MKAAQPTTFYLMRHGQTEWNVQRRVQGHTDTPLTAEGLEQARERAQSLRGVHFDAVFSSDLLRAKRTAEIVIADHNLLVTTNKLLREQFFGSYEGAYVEEFREELRRMIEVRKTLSLQENLDLDIGGGAETHMQVTTRLITFLREASAAYPGKTVLIVSHGSVIKSFLARLGEIAYADYEDVWLTNLGYVVVKSDGADFTVKEKVGIEVRKK